MGVVGTNHHSWIEKTEKFFKSIPKIALEKDFVDGTNKLREAKNRLFNELKFVVQAEPYNPFDSNAISVVAEDVEAKVSGFGGMCKVGYLRATGLCHFAKSLAEYICIQICFMQNKFFLESICGCKNRGLI